MKEEKEICATCKGEGYIKDFAGRWIKCWCLRAEEFRRKRIALGLVPEEAPDE